MTCERANTVVMAALVWSYSERGSADERDASNALLLAVEEYEDKYPNATHDALAALDRMRAVKPRTTSDQRKVDAK